MFVAPELLRPTVTYYKVLTSGHCSLYFPFPERGLELAAVSSPVASFLVIAGSEEAVAPFRATSLTVIVEDISSVTEHLVPLEAEELQPVTPVPTGYQTRLRHPDGLVAEYVQHTEGSIASAIVTFEGVRRHHRRMLAGDTEDSSHARHRLITG